MKANGSIIHLKSPQWQRVNEIFALEPWGIKGNGLLNRCIVGHFGQEIAEKVTLAGIRRWCSLTWKAVFEVNI